jgi:hypothetical protein
VDYFYTATNRRSRGATWSIFAPALIEGAAAMPFPYPTPFKG